MSFIISPVTTEDDQEAVMYLKHQVFSVEMGVPMSKLKLPETSTALELLAREELSGIPIAALTLLETSGDKSIHRKYNLAFRPDARSVRYTQLCVLRAFRGRSLPIRLILEGHRLLVEPGEFDYSWLLFNAQLASTSLLCRLLKFSPGAFSFKSEIGRSRVLFRNEHLQDCKDAIRRAESILVDSNEPGYPLKQHIA
jgi:hypothetical protein